MLPAVPPTLTTCVVRLALTNISFPCNAGIASCTNDVQLGTCSRRRLRRELRLVSDECNFQHIDYTSLAASASLLSSVIAFELGSPVTLYYLQKRGDVKAWIKPAASR
jgi:hypothetical protein